jgi:hypothetical protein
MSDTYDKLNHWYGWNGGECPVHPETEVEWLTLGKDASISYAGNCRWSHRDPDGFEAADIIAFRVIKLYKEPRKPREWWLNVRIDGHVDVYQPNEAFPKTGEAVYVREVLPEDEA